MQTNELAPTSKAKLDQLLGAITEALKSEDDCPHLTAVSASHFDRRSPLVFNGGGLVAPGKPQFDYDERELHRLHEAFVKSTTDVYRVIVHAQRPDDESEWTLTVKLVSVNEQESLENAVKPYSAEIESELRSIKHSGQLDFLTFGRSRGVVEVGIKVEGKTYERRPPSPKLVQILTLVDKVYEKAGLRLVSGDWTLRPASFDYSEYYE